MIIPTREAIRMEYLHNDFYLDSGDIVHVEIDHQANILLLDDSNYQNYRERRGFTHYGGHYDISPINIVVPSSGHWHVVIDLGGGAGTIRHSISIIKR